MMAVCPECGKKHVVLWPELSPFRRGDDYYCSPKCYEISVSRDMTKIKHVALIRRQRKNMKLKKDGTPAKKPGRKPQVKIETPEGEWTPAVDMNAPKKAEVPEKVPVVKVDGALKIETPDGNLTVNSSPIVKKPLEYKVTGIDTVIGTFQFFKKHGYVDWDPLDGHGTTVSLNVEEWKEFMKVFPEAMKVLGVEL